LSGAFRKRKNPLYILSSILIILVVAALIGGAAVIAAVVLIILVLFYPVFQIFWVKLYGLEDIADQVFHAHTDDGWNIAMHFHRPRYPKKGAYPVIFSHGIAVNKFGVDLDRAHSLAYFLKQNGYPVFVLSLRGVGKSYHSSRYGYRDFSFDDIVEYDVAAVIRKAKELTGSPKVNWVGHSMGGMIMYGFLGRKIAGHEDVASFTAIGSPGRLDHARTSIWGAISKYPWMSQMLDLKFGAQVVSPITGRFITPIEELVYNKEVVSSTTIRRLMKNGVENIAPGLSIQFTDWIKSGKEYTKDGSFNYRDSFKEIKIPSLFLAGARDHIAIRESVRFAFENTGSKIKELKIMGQEGGFPVDYCHTGLVLGDRAPLDIFPQVLEWLDTYGCEKKKMFFISKIVQKIKARGKKKKAAKVRTYHEDVVRGGVISS